MLCGEFKYKQVPLKNYRVEEMKELTDLSLSLASVLGATYSDVRITTTCHESITVKNGIVEEVATSIDSGFGVRVLANGAWGFASSFKVDKREIEQVTALAVKIAKASALAKKEDVCLSHVSATRDVYKTRYEIDPFKVPLDKKLEIFFAADKLMRKEKEIKIATSSMDSFRRAQVFASSVGSHIEQEITYCGGGISATAIRGNDVQTRSFPNAHRGQFATRGFEFFQSLKLPENAERIAEEAVALLSAEECPSTTTTLILDGSQLALQVHESIGHAIELDRVLGTEISLAGGSFLSLDKLENFQYGSEIVNVMADATIEGGLGTFGYDDEGVKAQRVRIIKDGKFMNYLTSRETGFFLGEVSNGAMRADGWNRIPLIRMTNINLEPGNWKLDDLIADTDEGIYLETNKSWSIDDLRLNFQFATEIGWEIKKGKLGKMLKNPNYTGITPVFWNSCDAICNQKHWQMWGLTNCGKGEPMQTAFVGHGASPARFRNVRIGVGK